MRPVSLETQTDSAGNFSLAVPAPGDYLINVDADQRQASPGLKSPVSNTVWSPLMALSWAPFRDGNTRVAGGYSLTLENPMDPEPLQIPPTVVPMPWDSPNWLLGWAYKPLP